MKHPEAMNQCISGGSLLIWEDRSSRFLRHWDAGFLLHWDATQRNWVQAWQFLDNWDPNRRIKRISVTTESNVTLVGWFLCAKFGKETPVGLQLAASHPSGQMQSSCPPIPPSRSHRRHGIFCSLYWCLSAGSVSIFFHTKIETFFWDVEEWNGILRWYFQNISRIFPWYFQIPSGSFYGMLPRGWPLATHQLRQLRLLPIDPRLVHPKLVIRWSSHSISCQFV